ncbi:MAG: anthranilate phosphoribosyltransferase [Solirubrobacteraceae bacterium]|nr:anthranilate phosphoribosyltransferase [Solirubrobacteraceae bacterium]
MTPELSSAAAQAQAQAQARRSGQSRAIYDGFRSTIKAVGTGVRGSRDLTFAEARAAMELLLRGQVTPAQSGAFLVAMRIKGESACELAGFAQALRDACRTCESTTGRSLVACAGAYDGVADAPHLSLAAGVVAAAAGAGVVLHCGDTLGPKYGVTVADVLGALGGPAAPSARQSTRMLEAAGVTVVHAGEVLPGWRGLAAIRDQVGVRGPIHSAEKLVDYYGARRFVVGHTHSSYSERLLGALELLGAERSIAVRGIEGSDVMRPGRPQAFEPGRALELPHRPDARPPRGEPAAAAGDRAARSAALTVRLLGGEAAGPLAYTVALNAGLRLYAAGVVGDTRDGLELAEAAVADGGAAATLRAMLAACAGP